MTALTRITTDPQVMGGRPCIRGLRVTVGTLVGTVTGSDPDARGAQLSVRVRGGRTRAHAVFAALQPAGLIADWREPDIIRLAPVPLYNSHEDCWRAAGILGAALAAQR